MCGFNSPYCWDIPASLDSAAVAVAVAAAAAAAVGAPTLAFPDVEPPW